MTTNGRAAGDHEGLGMKADPARGSPIGGAVAPKDFGSRACDLTGESASRTADDPVHSPAAGPP